MRTEIYITTFGPEDETGYREAMDHYQIPDKGSWRWAFGHIRDVTPPDGIILMYKATCDDDRKLVSVSPTPWRIR